jgi:acetyl esterase/lipase
MQVVDARQTQPFGNDPKADAVVFLAGGGAVAGTVHMHNHVIARHRAEMD